MLNLKRYQEVMSKDSITKIIDMASLSSEDTKELYKLSEDTKMEKTTMVCVCIIFLSTIIISGIIIIMGMR